MEISLRPERSVTQSGGGERPPLSRTSPPYEARGALWRRRMLAFGLTAPARIVAVRARKVAILAHVCPFGLRPKFAPLQECHICHTLYLEGGLRPALFRALLA